MKSIALTLLILAQIAIPLSMIRSKEKILQHGKPMKLLTRPIDPADPFQGRYVRLGFKHDYVENAETAGLRRNTRVYATFKTAEDGFTRFTAITHEKPTEGDYLIARYGGNRTQWNRETRTSTNLGARIQLPFYRFYMDEAKAPRAEVLAREATRSTNCWATIRVLDGKAVIEDVFAAGQSLRSLAASPMLD